MAVMNVSPTRMQLTLLKKQLMTARRGHKLLKDKRDELMRRFLETVRENRRLRAKVEAGIAEVNRAFLAAGSAMSPEALNSALLYPMQSVSVETSSQNVMSVEIPVYKWKTRSDNGGDLYAYGFADTSFLLDDAVTGLSKLLPDLLALAQAEKSAQLMAMEIEKTRRRVNALEHVMIPRYEETIRSISMRLEENERSNRARLMKVKDMMLNEAHHYTGRQR